jgi:ElaB/YqjD/DUF883 family membrane-anchored ribosome-binding protein
METLQSTPDRTMNKVREIPERAEDIAMDARARLNETMQTMSRRAGDAVKYTDQVVQANPWTSVGVGFGAGVVFGALLAMAVGASQRSTFSRMMR